MRKAFEDISIVTSCCGNEISKLSRAMCKCCSKIKELESQLGKSDDGNKVVVVEKEENTHKSALHKGMTMANNELPRCEATAVNEDNVHTKMKKN